MRTTAVVLTQYSVIGAPIIVLLKMFVKWIRLIKKVGSVPMQVGYPRGAESRCGYCAL